MAMKNRSLSRLAKSLKSGVIISFAIPLFNNSLMCIIHLFWADQYRGFEIISAIVSAIIILVFIFEFSYFYKPTGKDAHYFNGETGLIDYDCHFRTQVSGIVRRTEVWIFMCIPTVTWLVGMWKIASPAILLGLYLIVMIVNIVKASAHVDFRKDIVWVNMLKTLDMFFRAAMTFLMCLWWMPRMLNRGNKFMTIIYVIIIISDCICLLLIYLCRLYFEISKAYNWKKIAHLYPERPLMLNDAEKALASIGKPNKKHLVDEKGYSQLSAKEDSKPNAVVPFNSKDESSLRHLSNDQAGTEPREENSKVEVKDIPKIQENDDKWAA